MKGLIAIDIDGVLNSGECHEHLYQLLKDGLTISQISDSSEYPYRFFMGGDYVNQKYVERLKGFLAGIEGDVVGISSWFTGHDKDEIARFLGIPILTLTSSTVGDISRVRALVELVSIHRPEHLVIFDDQVEGYHEMGLSEHHIAPVGGGERS